MDMGGCPVEATLSVVGGKWKAVILWRLVGGTKRFNELQRSISQITRKMLTEQLRELEQDNLIIRTVYPEVPPKVEYSLSEYGRTFIPVLDAMAQWGLVHRELVSDPGRSTT
ncbi:MULTISPECIES: helix-turn-helix domain-containing protein [Paenibacillus]|nr:MULTISPECIES: helix-turn-helix domain-containing protein [Paenibacillus]MBJ9989555.1 helix-turn-helix transcriptional regulator [Paenibacillus sp. S28]MEC0174482.1 helix-turn-helix domain-containing protein [Paenibacillus favisporus]PQP88177.1 transcriptional regulator [Paenibacillus sp. AR247]